MVEKIALVFPGQGSQKLGMLAQFSENTLVRNSFLEASQALGYDLWALIQEGPEEKLNQTEHTQPAILTASVALFRCWLQCDEGSKIKKSISLLAGHSLGEYSALVYAEALSLASAVKLVRLRGQLMQAAVPMGTGAMAVILGLEDEQVRALCEKVSTETEKVSAVNYNCPLQVVVAGVSPAVARAMEEAKQLGAKRAMLLPVSMPSHCDLMKPAAEKFKQALEQVKFNQPKLPILHNADLSAHQDEASIRNILVQQLYCPVRWSETIQRMEDLGIQAIYECGPGKVLTGLNRRIVPNLKCDALPEEEVVCP